MKKMLLALPVLVLAASSAAAQSAHFKGFSIALNASLVSPTTDYETAGTPVASDTSNGTVLGLQSRYYFPITEQYLVGLGLNKSLTRIRAGTLSGVDSTLKDRISFDLSPAYALSDNTLLFGKLAFISGTFNLSSDDSNSTASGMGYGLGARYLVNKTFFLQGSFDSEQYNQVQFGASTQKVKASSFSVGVGVKF